MSKRRRRSTETFVCDRKLKNELVYNVTHPEILQEIFDRADRLVFVPKPDRPAAIAELTAFWDAQPCILWKPHHEEHSRHIVVQIRFEPAPGAVISVCRAVWACVHVVPEQGAQLSATEELLHSCGAKADSNTGWNSCLNPGHMVRVPWADRAKILQARRLMEQVGMMSRASA